MGETVNKTNNRISVRDLIEFILRNGDIDSRRGDSVDYDAMQAGAKLHRELQAKSGSHYHSEVSLSVTMDLDFAELTVHGRADGIIDDKAPQKGMPLEVEDVYKDYASKKIAVETIDEIKCMYRDIYAYDEPELLHLAQGKCYAYMYCLDKGYDHIAVRITYASLENKETKRFWYFYEFKELEEWFLKMVADYSKFLKYRYEHFKVRQESIERLEFPFEYRPGQRELAAHIYSGIKRKESFFAQAPTGVGKTISALFPAIKYMGESTDIPDSSNLDGIFYVTAKTITRTAAANTLDILRDKGLHLNSVVITAKDKTCVLDEHNCNPDACPRAKGHFDRINACLLDLISSEENINKEIIEEYAEAHNVCPFELSLDVSLFVDCVICDYNYVFDPKVRLKRFFSSDKSRKYHVLVDEAHNLVDRGRSMYSAMIDKNAVMDVIEQVKTSACDDKAVRKSLSYALSQVDRELSVIRNAYDERDNGQDYIKLPDCDMLSVCLLRFNGCLDKALKEHIVFEDDEKVMQLYFDSLHFINMYETLDSKYIIYAASAGKDSVRVHLFCVNPSNRIKEVIDLCHSVTYFSATLLPISYYKELIGPNDSAKAVYIPSPFDSKNRYLAITRGVTSLYQLRDMPMYEKMARYIDKMTEKPGNYMVFFSSYKLLQDVFESAVFLGVDQRKKIILQEIDMTEEEREEFLKKFDRVRKKPMLAFVILGGIFSEGIDLVGDKLIGSIIVGNGLPQIDVRGEILREYFAEQGFDGFAYAYQYPGMNKVLQAAGRVIRTESDRGIIMLMDSRFERPEYRRMFPREWSDVRVINEENIKGELENFWSLDEE